MGSAHRPQNVWDLALTAGAAPLPHSEAGGHYCHTKHQLGEKHPLWSMLGPKTSK